jgi:NADPH:quinone reductase
MTPSKALRVKVSRFGEPEVLRIEEFAPRQPRRRTVRVRVTHASVGSTDAAARSGDYLFQPRPGFVPGYDFVGVLETVNSAAAHRGLQPGMRVTGCLARMGGYATQLVVPPDRLVPVPDELDSPSAAALPLDLVTTELALELAHLRTGATIFMQGVSGSVGALITQRAIAEGMTVVGTASDRTRGFAEALGAGVVDYHDPDWPARVRELTSGGADASIDHTGGQLVRSATARSGTVVRTAWSGRPGRGRIDAALGGPATIARRYAHPRERLCSVPMLVALRPAEYRQMLQDDLNRIVEGSLRGPTVTTVPFAEVVDAHRRLAALPPGHKLVLEMPSG